MGAIVPFASYLTLTLLEIVKNIDRAQFQLVRVRLGVFIKSILFRKKSQKYDSWVQLYPLHLI